jgi:hypothetical protein
VTRDRLSTALVTGHRHWQGDSLAGPAVGLAGSHGSTQAAAVGHGWAAAAIEAGPGRAATACQYPGRDCAPRAILRGHFPASGPARA